MAAITQPLRVCFEDNHLLVVDKPAGIATMGAASGEPTMARQAAAYLKQKYGKPGNVFVGVVSRLDRLVSGVLVLARTSKAASRLSEQIRQHTTLKRYLAIVEGSLQRAKLDRIGRLGRKRRIAAAHEAGRTVAQRCTTGETALSQLGESQPAFSAGDRFGDGTQASDPVTMQRRGAPDPG